MTTERFLACSEQVPVDFRSENFESQIQGFTAYLNGGNSVCLIVVTDWQRFECTVLPRLRSKAFRRLLQPCSESSRQNRHHRRLLAVATVTWFEGFDKALMALQTARRPSLKLLFRCVSNESRSAVFEFWKFPQNCQTACPENWIIQTLPGLRVTSLICPYAGKLP